VTLARKAAPLLAAALAIVAFLPALQAAFVNWDDEVSFLTNPHFRGFGPRQIAWMFTTRLLGHWSPLAWMTWSLNYVVGGLDPWGYHLVNVLLHAANVALFCLVARRLLAVGFSAPPGSVACVAGALLAALVFGLHPLRAESVAWVSERRDLLCAFFYLLAVLAYLRGVESGGPIARRWWAWSTAAFAAALLSKAIAMTLPFTLLLLDVYPLRRRGLGWRALAIEKAPFLALAAGAGLMAVLARQEGGNITGYAQYGPTARLALVGYSFWFYPWKFLWPSGLSPAYELPTRVDLWQARFLLPLLLAAVVTAALVALRHRWPAGLTAWISSAIVLAPISGVVHSGNHLANDRYSYLSGLGFAVLAGSALTWSIRRGQGTPAQRWIPRLACAAAAVLVVALGLGARAQAAVWHDSETLWRRAVSVDAACALCESNLGRVIARPGRYEEAEARVREAIALRPDRPGAYENLGAILLAQGRQAEAEVAFRQAVRLRPEHGPYRNNLGVALANQGRDAEAEVEFREATRLSARLVDAPANLAVLLSRQGRHDESVVALRQALAIDPTSRRTRGALARALRSRASQLAAQGQANAAEQLLQEAVVLAADGPAEVSR